MASPWDTPLCSICTEFTDRDTLVWEDAENCQFWSSKLHKIVTGGAQVFKNLYSSRGFSNFRSCAVLGQNVVTWPTQSTSSKRQNSFPIFKLFFRCKEHLYKRLRSSVGPSVPHDAITWKTSYVAIASRRGGRGNWLCRDSITSRFLRT
jgi:hypothetical protein